MFDAIPDPSLVPLSSFNATWIWECTFFGLDLGVLDQLTWHSQLFRLHDDPVAFLVTVHSHRVGIIPSMHIQESY